MKDSSSLESKIAQHFGRQHCVLTGSGTTALFLLFKALNLPCHTPVLYPNNTCETAVNACIFAGLEPVFCDVSQTTFRPSAEQRNRAIAKHSPAVYVATHVFGLPVDTDDLQQDNIIVIEDAAQGYGLRCDTSKIGRIGRASVLSFGKDKTIDCGAGGALLTDDTELFHHVQHILSGMNLQSAIEGSLMMDVFTLRRQYASDSEEYQKRYRQLLQKHSNAYLSSMNDETRAQLLERFADIPHIIEERIARVAELKRTVTENIDDDNLHVPLLPDDSLIWKLPFTVNPTARDEIAAKLENKAVQVTKFFKPLHFIFDPNNQELEESVQLYRSIINII